MVIGKTNLGINPGHSCQQNSTSSPWDSFRTLHTPQTCRTTIIVSQAHQAFAYAVPYTWSALLLLGHPVNSHSCHRSQDRHHLLRETFPKWPSHQFTVNPDLMPGGSPAVLMATSVPWLAQDSQTVRPTWSAEICTRHDSQLRLRLLLFLEPPFENHRWSSENTG